MPISEKDREFMEKVAAYFDGTKTPQEPKGSIRDTALKFGINRNKIRKILITMGRLESPITEEAVRLRQKGMSIKEIAHDLGVSVATVSTALPYEGKVDNTLEPSEHASDVREYRAYERKQRERQAGRASRKEDAPAAWKGDKMEGREQAGKEWQKDIRMSYTEAYHRPHRSTWAEIEEMRELLAAELTVDSPKELKGLLAVYDSMDQQNDEEQQEMDRLLSKKRLTKEEKNKLILLSYFTGNYPGALNNRNEGVLEQIAGFRVCHRRYYRLHRAVAGDRLHGFASQERPA